MLSAQALERASHYFRRGYNDGGTLGPRKPPPVEGTFAHTDYNEGYKAGLNDRYWGDFNAGYTSLTRDEFLSQYI
jgi:hypothetical protein